MGSWCMVSITLSRLSVCAKLVSTLVDGARLLVQQRQFVLHTRVCVNAKDAASET